MFLTRAGFDHFPTRLWRNTVAAGSIEWLRTYNGRQEIPERMAGFYGIDLYSLYRSIEAVIGYLDYVDPPRPISRATEPSPCCYRSPTSQRHPHVKGMDAWIAPVRPTRSATQV